MRPRGAALLLPALLARAAASPSGEAWNSRPGCNASYTRGVLSPGRVCADGYARCRDLSQCEAAARDLGFGDQVKVRRDTRALRGCYLGVGSQVWWNPAGSDGAEHPGEANALCLEGIGVVTWGDSDAGGDSASVAALISSQVKRVYANDRAFAAVTLSGDVVTWGAKGWGGDSSTVGSRLRMVSAIYSAEYSFAALTEAGAVVPWGSECPDAGGRSEGCGGDAGTVAELLQQGVTAVRSTDTAFAAITSGGRVVTWGRADSGGDSASVAAQLSSGVVSIVSTSSSFSALRNDQSVVTWGSAQAESGGRASGVVAHHVQRIFANAKAFAALTAEGAVVTWGPATGGGDASTCAAQLAAGVVDIASTRNAFAALKSDGSVVAWGHYQYGGDDSTVQAKLLSGGAVRRIRSNQWAFAALQDAWRGGGHSVVAWGGWGHDTAGVGCCGADTTTVAGLVSSGVAEVYSTDAAFAALRTNGRVVTWGYIDPAGANAQQLNSGVVSVCSTSAAFAAVKDDGTLVTWGDPSVADYSQKVSGACRGVVTLSATKMAFAAGVPSSEASRCPPAAAAVSPSSGGVAAAVGGAVAGAALLAGIAVYFVAPSLRGRRRRAGYDDVGPTPTRRRAPAEERGERIALCRLSGTTVDSAALGPSAGGAASPPLLKRDAGGEVFVPNSEGEEDALTTWWSSETRRRSALAQQLQLNRITSIDSLQSTGRGRTARSATPGSGGCEATARGTAPWSSADDGEPRMVSPEAGLRQDLPAPAPADT